MKRRTFLAGSAASLAAPARAQAQWPLGQPIRIIVPFPAGAANDAMGRLAGQVLHEKLGATVVVENRAGGSASIGTTAVLNAAPDGYTLLASAFNHIILNHAVKSVTFDPQADFEVIGRTARAPLLMVLAPNRPEKTIAEMIAAAKATPNDWTFAIPALGAPSHLATVDFMSRAGLTIATSPYRGTAPALTDVIGGHVQLLIDASFALLPAAKEGRVKALGITTRDRSALAPDFPTVAEQGFAGYDFQSWYGLWAPKGTPREICARVNALMRETMRDPGVVERLNQSLLEPVIETSDESKAFIATEVPKHVALLKKAGFEAQ
ncbi:MAG: tripartite tricarboxylate transporter substrate binding protein [Alphaproteobacteria bacterium]